MDIKSIIERKKLDAIKAQRNLDNINKVLNQKMANSTQGVIDGVMSIISEAVELPKGFRLMVNIENPIPESSYENTEIAIAIIYNISDKDYDSLLKFYDEKRKEGGLDNFFFKRKLFLDSTEEMYDDAALIELQYLNEGETKDSDEQKKEDSGYEKSSRYYPFSLKRFSSDNLDINMRWDGRSFYNDAFNAENLIQKFTIAVKLTDALKDFKASATLDPQVEKLQSMKRKFEDDLRNAKSSEKGMIRDYKLQWFNALLDEAQSNINNENDKTVLILAGYGSKKHENFLRLAALPIEKVSNKTFKVADPYPYDYFIPRIKIEKGVTQHVWERDVATEKFRKWWLGSSEWDIKQNFKKDEIYNELDLSSRYDYFTLISKKDFDILNKAARRDYNYEESEEERKKKDQKVYKAAFKKKMEILKPIIEGVKKEYDVFHDEESE